jgi:hypothetical protein
MVALLETPALQCTNTLCCLISYSINFVDESKKHLMFSEGSSATSILKCLISFGSFNYASPMTVITALIPFYLKVSTSFANITLPSANPFVFLLYTGSMIQLK